MIHRVVVPLVLALLAAAVTPAVAETVRTAASGLLLTGFRLEPGAATRPPPVPEGRGIEFLTTRLVRWGAAGAGGVAIAGWCHCRRSTA
jgi:hypothetical protein